MRSELDELPIPVMLDMFSSIPTAGILGRTLSRAPPGRLLANHWISGAAGSRPSVRKPRLGVRVLSHGRGRAGFSRRCVEFVLLIASCVYSSLRASGNSLRTNL